MRREWAWTEQKEDRLKKKQKREQDKEDKLEKTNQNLLQQNGEIKRNIKYADPPWEYTIQHHEKGTTMSGLSNQHY